MNRRKAHVKELLLLVVMCNQTAASQEKGNVIVAKDGSGQYTSIQEALNAVPRNNSSNVLILVRNGIYREKLYVQKSNVTLVGEDRDSTRIVYAELRKNWNKEHDGSDWGSAVINIDSTVTDLTLANLTVYNDYGSLYGSHDHQFTIKGEGTRIIIVYCNVISDGGDALSLWNREKGMYYHSNCSFEGWVDYVCPRGWCYVTDCRFYGHNLSASIWHDGSANKEEKFVIRYSYFDGVPGFPLARHHRDAQFYLLDCIFSRNMADKPIYLPISPNATVWKWGARHYFYNCHRVGGDFDWFKDNLQTAEWSPRADQIDAKWTFNGKWDPEDSMASVLPFVAFPRPRDAAYGVSSSVGSIDWIGSRDADSHNVYFGESTDPGFQGTHRGNSFEIGMLQAGTTYFWRIDEVCGQDTVRGPLWHFTTED